MIFAEPALAADLTVGVKPNQVFEQVYDDQAGVYVFNTSYSLLDPTSEWAKQQYRTGELCWNMASFQAIRAVNAFVDVGIFDAADFSMALCPRPAEVHDDHWSQDPYTHQFFVDPDHSIRMTSDVNDPLWNAWFNGPLLQQEPVPIARTLSVIVDTTNGATVREDPGWDITLRHDRTWLDGKPSGTYESYGTFENFWFDMVAHELMHVMGAEHVSEAFTAGESALATLMYPHSIPIGHYGAEVNADLYHSPPLGGVMVLPYADVHFLEREYPAMTTPPTGVRVHTWTPVEANGIVDFEPMGFVRGWTEIDADYTSWPTIASACPGTDADSRWKLDPTDIPNDLLVFFPGISSDHDHPGVHAVLLIRDAPGGSLLGQFNDRLSVELVGDDLIHRDDMVTIGPGFNGHLNWGADYNTNGVLSLSFNFFDPNTADMEVTLPIRAYIPRQCGCNEDPQLFADNCCGPADCSE